LPEVGTASDNEDHDIVSEEFDESEDVSASDEEQVNEPSTTRTRKRSCKSWYGKRNYKRYTWSTPWFWSWTGRAQYSRSDTARPSLTGRRANSAISAVTVTVGLLVRHTLSIYQMCGLTNETN